MLVREQVAAVIGEARADVELGKLHAFNERTELRRAFTWFATPQGWKFWRAINHGNSPYKDNDYNY